MSVFISPLPDYTTERYYLLSELEESAKDVDCLDELNIHVDYYMNFLSNKSTIVVMYLLWRKATGISNLNASLHSLLGDRTRDHSNKILHVEVLINPSNRKTANYRQEIIDELCLVLVNIKKSFDIGCVCLGVCDHTSGTPALETAVKSIQFAPRNVLRLYCRSRIELLGFDTESQPDATSDVFQLLLATEDPTAWMKRTLPQYKAIYLSNSTSNSNHSYITSNLDNITSFSDYQSDNILIRLCLDLFLFLVRHVYSFYMYYLVFVIGLLFFNFYRSNR